MFDGVAGHLHLLFAVNIWRAFSLVWQEASRMAQLSVMGTFLMLRLHSCELSNCVEDGFHKQRAVATNSILQVILA